MPLNTRNKPNADHGARRHFGQRTVLGVAIPVLAATINAMRQELPFMGLSEAEIVTGFRSLQPVSRLRLPSNVHPASPRPKGLSFNHY